MKKAIDETEDISFSEKHEGNNNNNELMGSFEAQTTQGFIDNNSLKTLTDICGRV
jgi:hypothetical protein